MCSPLSVLARYGLDRIVITHRAMAVGLWVGLAGGAGLRVDGFAHAGRVAGVGVDQALRQVFGGLLDDAARLGVLAVGRLVALVRLALDAVVFDLRIGVDEAVFGFGNHGYSPVADSCMNPNASRLPQSRN